MCVCVRVRMCEYVCVCTICRDVKLLNLEGRVALMSYHAQRSCGHEWEGKRGRFPVPAILCKCICIVLPLGAFKSQLGGTYIVSLLVYIVIVSCYLNIYIYICSDVCMYVCMHACMYVCMYIHHII